MDPAVAYPLGWALALLVAVLAVVRAVRESSRETEERDASERRRQQRRVAALAMLEGIHDADVRDAWPRIVAVLEDGSLTDGDDVRGLRDALAAGGGRQLAEEVAIEISDASPDTVSLYHMGFVPPTLPCPRDALLRVLAQLADELDALDQDDP